MANVTDELNAPAEIQESPKWRGCLYACIFVLVGGLATILCSGIGLYWFVSGQVTKYTSPVPMDLPMVEFDEQEMSELKKRIDSFTEAIDRGETPGEDLVLTAIEINALITQEKEWKGKVFVSIQDGEIKCDVCIPTDDFLVGSEGRFFNCKTTVDVSMDRGMLIVNMMGAEVKGEKVPRAIMDEVAKENLAKDFNHDPKAAKVLRNLDSVLIDDDKLVLKFRRDQESIQQPEETAPADADGAPDEGSAKDEPELTET